MNSEFILGKIQKMIIESYRNKKETIMPRDMDNHAKRKETRRTKSDKEVWKDITENYYFRGENLYFEKTTPSLFRNNEKSDLSQIDSIKKTLVFIKNIRNLATKQEEVIDTMINWRHSGRSSPLIDLTTSLCIALFFACIPTKEKREIDFENNGFINFYHKSLFTEINSQDFEELFFDLPLVRLWSNKTGFVIESRNWVHPNIKKQCSVICYPFKSEISPCFSTEINNDLKKNILEWLEKDKNTSMESIFSGPEGVETSLAIEESKHIIIENKAEIALNTFFEVLVRYNADFKPLKGKSNINPNEIRINFLNHFRQFYPNTGVYKNEKSVFFLLYSLESEFNHSLKIETPWNIKFISDFIQNELCKGNSSNLCEVLNPNRILQIDKELHCLKFYVEKVVSFKNWRDWINNEEENIDKLIVIVRSCMIDVASSWWDFLEKMVSSVFIKRTRNPLKISESAIEKMYESVNEREWGVKKVKELLPNNEVFVKIKKDMTVFLSHISLVLILCQGIYCYKNNGHIWRLEPIFKTTMKNLAKETDEQCDIEFWQLFPNRKKDYFYNQDPSESEFANQLSDLIKNCKDALKK